MDVVHLGVDPQTSTDAVTMSARHRTVAADHAKRPGLQRFEHHVVERIAAGGNHGAFGWDVTHVLAVLIGGNAAGDASVLALELDHLGVVVKAGALLDAIVVENLVAVERLAGTVVERAPARRMTCREVMMVSGIDLVARFVPEFHAAFGQTIAVPINRGAGIVAPNLDQILLQVAGSVHRHGANEFELVDLGSLLFLIAGIHGGQVVANAGAGRESVDADHLGPSSAAAATANIPPVPQPITRITVLIVSTMSFSAISGGLPSQSPSSAASVLVMTSTGISPLACAMHLEAAL